MLDSHRIVYVVPHVSLQAGIQMNTDDCDFNLLEQREQVMHLQTSLDFSKAQPQQLTAKYDEVLVMGWAGTSAQGIVPLGLRDDAMGVKP